MKNIMKTLAVALLITQASSVALADKCEDRIYNMLDQSVLQGGQIEIESEKFSRISEKKGVVTAIISVYSRDDGGMDFDFDFKAKRISTEKGADCKILKASVVTGNCPDAMYVDSEYTPAIHKALQKLVKAQKVQK